MSANDSAAIDPVLAKRARIDGLVKVGKRVGYGLYLLAIVVFFVALFTEIRSWMSTLIIVSLVIGSLVLAPAIVFGYGVKSAIRDDREHGRL